MERNQAIPSRAALRCSAFGEYISARMAWAVGWVSLASQAPELVWASVSPARSLVSVER